MDTRNLKHGRISGGSFCLDGNESFRRNKDIKDQI